LITCDSEPEAFGEATERDKVHLASREISTGLACNESSMRPASATRHSITLRDVARSAAAEDYDDQGGTGDRGIIE